MSEPVSSAAWWNDRYREGDTGWDKGQVAPPIGRIIAEGVVPRGRVAVLGAGRGHEVLALARAGYPVTAVDFAEEACLASSAAAREARVEIEGLHEDLFSLPRTHAGGFDAALEHTCFCAIDPSRRSEYAEVVRRLLKPGALYFGLFYAHG